MRLPEVVEAYDRLATAISVLCDQTYFGGGTICWPKWPL